MGRLWIGVAVAACLGLAAAIVKRLMGGEHRSPDVDVGPVSEGWLAEQRGRKDS